MDYLQWLHDFFEFNSIRLDAIIGQKYKEPRQSLFNAFLFPIKQQQTYIALPYVEKKHLPVRIYIFGIHEFRALLELQTILKNAVGSAYIEYCDLIAAPTTNDFAANILLKEFPVGIIRLSYFINVSSDDIFNGFYLIQRLIQILNRRPVLVQMRKRSVGRILREFYLAKEEGDYEIVWQCFEELKGNSSLGAKNIIFLEIQTLAIVGQWTEIRTHSKLKYLIGSLMPVHLLQNILDALGQLGSDQLLDKPLEVTVDIQNLQKEYEKFEPIFTRLLELPNNPKYKRQWQQWIIGCSLLGQYQYFEQIPKFIEMKWCGELKQKINDHGYFIQMREGKHCGLTLTIPQSVDQTRIYLNYCLSLSPENWHDIWHYLEKISLEIRSYLNQDLNLKEKWERIESYCGKKIIYDWNNWFEQVMDDQEFDSDNLLLKLHNEYQIWTPKNFIESQLVKTLHINEERVNEVLRDALPIMLEWLNENQVDLSIETVLMLFILLIDDEKNDPNDLQLFYELFMYWKKLRKNQHYDYQVVMSLELLLKKCQLNPLYQLPLYQRRVVQTIEGFKKIEDIQSVDIQLLEKFIQK